MMMTHAIKSVNAPEGQSHPLKCECLTVVFFPLLSESFKKDFKRLPSRFYNQQQLHRWNKPLMFYKHSDQEFRSHWIPCKIPWLNQQGLTPAGTDKPLISVTLWALSVFQLISHWGPFLLWSGRRQTPKCNRNCTFTVIITPSQSSEK